MLGIMRLFFVFLIGFSFFSFPALAGKCVELERGTASWYGPGFYESHTSSGEKFHPGILTAAHPSLPFGTNIKVTNLLNNRSVHVRINDRGAFKKNIIDVSQGAAHELGMIEQGTVPVALFQCYR